MHRRRTGLSARRADQVSRLQTERRGVASRCGSRLAQSRPCPRKTLLSRVAALPSGQPPRSSGKTQRSTMLPFLDTAAAETAAPHARLCATSGRCRCRTRRRAHDLRGAKVRARAAQARVRPRQRLPAQPEHQALVPATRRLWPQHAARDQRHALRVSGGLLPIIVFSRERSASYFERLCPSRL